MKLFRLIKEKVITPFNHWWMGLFIYTCRELSELLVMERDLTFVQKFRLKIHTNICGACKDYENDMKALNVAYRKVCDRHYSSQDSKKVMALTEEIIKKHSS
ncbi:MAG: hypothetical protein AB8E15_10125 [Bdellovibrionales bacterium]